jgi:ABC-type transporter Mla subunit MlaD
MALQDLTPQLRTRLSRMERAVGWFVLLALALLVFGFAYYFYNTAERKGWFKTKARYYTYTSRATGLRVGDPVELMGLPVGQITVIEPMAPEASYSIYVEFVVKDPYYGYLWTEGSVARVATADLLGKRVVEITKGTNGYPTYVFNPLREVPLAEARTLGGKWALAQELYDPQSNQRLARALTPLAKLPDITSAGLTRLRVLNQGEVRKTMTGIWNDQEGAYDVFTPKSSYHLIADESPALTDRLDQLVRKVELALPNILALTNQLGYMLNNSSELASNLNVVALGARPAVSNLSQVLSGLDHPGALGELLLPTNLNARLETTLDQANTTLNTANTNLAVLAENLNRSLESLASMTSNLNQQVQANTNLVSGVAKTIENADQLIQGLKRHWLLRSAFREPKTNAPSAVPSEQLRSPKDVPRR